MQVPKAEVEVGLSSGNVSVLIIVPLGIQGLIAIVGIRIPKELNV